MPNWTEEQKQAIYEKNNNILVAAAAGSGKTAVLVERIIHKVIEENIDIDKLLVVTFTNAAASEMRERVLNALYKKMDEEPENEDLQRQVTLLQVANICTIDSFCLEIVKNYFYELENVSPNFRIADTPEIELLKQEVLDEMFEEKYEKDEEDFTKLIDTYTSYRDDTPLKDLVLKIYNFIYSSPNPREWLHQKIEMFNLGEKINQDFSKSPWGDLLLSEMKDEVKDDLILLKDVLESLENDADLDVYYKAILSDIEQLKTLEKHLDNWDEAYNIAQNLKLISWPRKKVESEIKEEAKKVRDQVKDKLYKKMKKILVTDSKQSNEDIQNMYETLEKLEKFILEFDEIFSKRKRERNIVDFTDIEHFALSILLKEDENGNLVKSDVAKKYTNKFEEIAIDEYQDSNMVQEKILTSVSRGNNIFMVGDVKQSIYKFRQAMPRLFLDKYETYQKVGENIEDGEKIQLFKNFRSRKNILDFTNYIFENIMSKKLGDVEYNEEEYLNLGATDYPEVSQNLKTEIKLIDAEDLVTTENSDITQHFEDYELDGNSEEDLQEKERVENIELEARYIACKIQELIDTKFQVYDKNTKETRDIQYKDIVILLRSTKDKAPVYEQELSKIKIPVFSDSTEQYLESMEIDTIMNLLKIIDNPIQDIPLVAVLRSKIGGFTDNELVEIRLIDGKDDFYTCMEKAKIQVGKNLSEKIENFLMKLDNWRKEQEYMALDEFIWKIYLDTNFYHYVGFMPNGELRQANLKMLFERAKQFESTRLKGLYQFIQYIERLQIGSGDLSSAKIIGENDNVVRIMSIHKSKGLEFPVVFLANSNKRFNMQDIRKDPVLLHQDLGIGAKYIDYYAQVQYDTLAREAVKRISEVENLSEEMRVLYVALTRAKEKLYITGIQNKAEEKLEKLEKQVEIYPREDGKISSNLIRKANSYLEWMLFVLLSEKEGSKNVLDYTIEYKNDLLKKWNEVLKNIEQDSNFMQNLEIEDIDFEDVKKIIEYEYPFMEATVIPTKTSVTELKAMFKEGNVLKEDFQNNVMAGGDIQNSLGDEENIQSNTKIESDIQNNVMTEGKFKSNVMKKDGIQSNIMIEELIQKKIISEEKSVGNENWEEKNNVNNELNFPKPEFLKEEKEKKLTSAQKGTVMHLCLQRLDNKRDYTGKDLKDLVEDLTVNGIITQKEAESVNINKILKFIDSKIGKELKTAKEIFKEKPFYIQIPAKDIYKDLVGNKEELIKENVLVQGIVDLFYINAKDELVLVDYKTDYIKDDAKKELTEKYKVQIDLYTKALENALEKPVSKRYIYSVHNDEVIQV